MEHGVAAVIYITLALVLVLVVFGMVILTIQSPHKLWLDDERPAPEGWYWAHTSEEAISYLQVYTVQDMSLDHDLGVCLKCKLTKQQCHHDGYYVLKQIAEHNLWPRNKPKVHSMNPIGRERMESFIERYFPTGDKV